jgi:hypothetical protein
VLDELEDELMEHHTIAKPQIGPFVRALLPILAEDPLTILMRVRLTCTYVPLDDLAAFFQTLAATNELHAEALMKACDMLAGMAYRNNDPAQLERLERTLAASEDERLRRLALALLQGHDRRSYGAWNRQRLARLQIYRADPSVLVASAAQFTLPKEEDGEEEL